MAFVPNCYLIKHAQGWMMWDTGVADAVPAMPDGQKPADPRATHWKRPKTLASQLEQLGARHAEDGARILRVSGEALTPPAARSGGARR